MQQAMKAVKRLAKIIKKDDSSEDTVLVEVDVKPLLEEAKRTPIEGFDLSSVSKNNYYAGEGTYLAFLSGDKKKAISHLLTCKDYFQEMYWCMINKDHETSYRLDNVVKENFNEGQDFSNPGFLVISGKSAEEAENNIENALSFIHEIETINGFQLTKVSYAGTVKIEGNSYYNTKAASHKAELWMLSPSLRWFLASPLMSFYMMLIRAGISYGKERRESGALAYIKYLEDTERSVIKDQYYFSKTKGFYKRLFAQPVEKVFGTELAKNYPANRRTQHQEGYMWMATMDYRDTFPHWKKV